MPYAKFSRVLHALLVAPAEPRPTPVFPRTVPFRRPTPKPRTPSTHTPLAFTPNASRAVDPKPHTLHRAHASAAEPQTPFAEESSMPQAGRRRRQHAHRSLHPIFRPSQPRTNLPVRAPPRPGFPAHRQRSRHPAALRRRPRPPRRAGQGRPLGPRRHPVRQPVPRHRLGQVGHRPRPRHDRRLQGEVRGRLALRRRRQRPRTARSPHEVQGDGRGIGPELVRSLLPHQGPPPLYARRDDRRTVRAAARDRRARHARPAPARGHRCPPADLQGPQVAPHARRPGLHGALDPLRGDAAGAGGGDRAAAPRRPRGDPPGDGAQPVVLSNDLLRSAER